MVAAARSAQARALVTDAAQAQQAARTLLDAEDQLVTGIRELADTHRRRLLDERLHQADLARLREASDGRLRLGSLQAAGLTTVGQVIAQRQHLHRYPGLGAASIAQIEAAIESLAASVEADTVLRPDPDRRSPADTYLLRSLHRLVVTRRRVRPVLGRARELHDAVAAHLGGARTANDFWRSLFRGRQGRRADRAALAALEEALRSPRLETARTRVLAAEAALANEPTDAQLWRKYQADAATYLTLLAEVTGPQGGEHGPAGHLSSDAADRIDQLRLDTSLLKSTLRGYQSFGARFMIVQRRVILGDEMGLGKTVETLAAMCHLAAQGERHFLVVCPPSLAGNWMHEIRRHCKLTPRLLYGGDAAKNLGAWRAQGGIGVTSYTALERLDLGDATIAMAAFDEAHYIKNPATKRTRHSRAVIDRAERVTLLTGTPLENRVAEFAVLTEHINPAVAQQAAAAPSPDAFREAIAPAYLRRNQSDVLSELPDRIETVQPVSLSPGELVTYRKAVWEGHFMTMRRATFGDPARISTKLDHIRQIADEALAEGHKVLVFSYFRDVLTAVAAALGNRAHGPLTGTTPPLQRQQIVDAFTASRRPAVLVSQIEVGGVGLNLQTASVVVLVEPQWKPSIEEQAIARCHRMGQVRPVQVFRLIAEDTVDTSMRELVAGKAALFDEYARPSAAKDANAQAVDVSDNDGPRTSERQIIEQERARLRESGDEWHSDSRR
ncbi:helicase SNF2 [Catellatospora sp. TT07R-123]|uniref:DEAD/DEAH box helicase n=1 Tax=Catellatospora sp. TT07R-123 TaxID=2733863 RepID=UPI001B1BE83C|nr:DEAD/DEAH box helicase [Catellatospora sp. TT07R-123]GHJ43567.1 helicase SNF2 [Catellatospora sp. TT07R-123]